MITAIIMASGLSTRMGTNKLLLKYKNKLIIEYTFELIKELNFEQIIVVSKYDEIMKLSKIYNFQYVYNENANLGQSESIKLGVLHSENSDGYIFFVGDQPFLEMKYIKEMINTFNKDKQYIIIPRHNYINGNPVIFPWGKREKLLKLKNDEKGKMIISEADKIKYVSVSKDMLIDIDTKEDYKKLGVQNEKNKNCR